MNTNNSELNCHFLSQQSARELSKEEIAVVAGGRTDHQDFHFLSAALETASAAL